MPYTAVQQGNINAAKAALDSADKNLKNAIAAYNSANNNFCNEGWWSYLNDCDIRKASTRARKLLLNALTAGISAWTNNFLNKKWSKPTSCQQALEIGELVSWECQRGKGSCIKSETCDNKIAEYNAKINGVYTASSNALSAKQVYDQAKANYEAILNGVASEVQNDPAYLLAQAQIKADTELKKKRTQNLLIFGVLAIVALVFVMMIIRRSGS